MDEHNVLQLLGKVSKAESGQVFRDYLRGAVRTMICEVMAAEVSELCGKKHSPVSPDTFRAGTAAGRVLVEGEREEVIRPRVRRRQADGSSTEVQLASYASANDPQQLEAHVLQALISGVSTRQIAVVKPNSPGVGRSSVSRLWQEVGGRLVNELRGRNP